MEHLMETTVAAAAHLECNVLPLSVAVQPQHQPIRLPCLLLQVNLQVLLVLQAGRQAGRAPTWLVRELANPVAGRGGRASRILCSCVALVWQPCMPTSFSQCFAHTLTSETDLETGRMKRSSVSQEPQARYCLSKSISMRCPVTLVNTIEQGCPLSV